jgi:hypothetical protein
MNHIKYFFLFTSMILFSMLAFPKAVHADSGTCDPVIFGDSCVLSSGQTMNNGMVVFGGAASIEEGATVNGSLVITGGSLSLAGIVNGDITVIGGPVNLESSAVITGSLTTVGASLNRADGAEVLGGVNVEQPQDFNWGFGSIPFNIESSIPRVSLDLNPLWNIVWTFLRTLAVAALAVVVVLLWQNPTEQVAGMIVSQPVQAGFMGLMTVVVAPALIILLAITIILSPLSLVGILALGIGALFGWIALGLEVGSRMAGAFKVDWAPAVKAGAGTLVMTLLVSLVALIPCVGWLVPALAAILALGGVVIAVMAKRQSVMAPVVVTASVGNNPDLNG